MKSVNQIARVVLGTASHTITEVEVRGQHGVYPPVDELKESVERWLNRLLIFFKQDLCFGLQVECRRIPGSRKLHGVWALSRAAYNPSSIELRVRPPKSEYHWPCHLICPDEQLAALILGFARPAMVGFSDAHNRTRELRPSDVAVGRKERRYAKAQEAPQERLEKLVCRRATLRVICSALEERRGSAAAFDYCLIEEILWSVLGISKPDEELLFRLINRLVIIGVLEPVVKKREGLRFAPTVLFDEFVVVHRLNQRVEYIEQLAQQLEHIQGCLDRNEKERRRLTERLEALKGQDERLLGEQKELKAQMVSLGGC